MTHPFTLTIFLAFCTFIINLQAALVLNPSQPITHILPVNVIQVADDFGNNAAPLFGTPTEQATIFGFVDQIWAQAGIDIDFTFTLGTHNNSNTLNGINTLSQVVSQGDAAGVTDPLRLDLFMTLAPPGNTPPLSTFSVAGLAFVPGDGVSMWAGPDLATFTAGQEVIASVLAHEIGHNLGLPHPLVLEDINGESFDENLLVGSGSPPALTDGERLLQSQIDTAKTSPLLIAIPEPSKVTLIIIGLGALGFLHRKRKV